MNCPECEGQLSPEEVRDVGHTVNGQTTVIRGVTAKFCRDCDEFLMQPQHAQHYADALQRMKAESK